jgi:hypothetical protein
MKSFKAPYSFRAGAFIFKTNPLSDPMFVCFKNEKTSFLSYGCRIYERVKNKPHQTTGLHNLLHTAMPAFTKKHSILDRTFKLGIVAVVTTAAHFVRYFSDIVCDTQIDFLFRFHAAHSFEVT